MSKIPTYSDSAVQGQLPLKTPIFVYGDLVEVVTAFNSGFYKKFYEGLIGTVISAELNEHTYKVRFNKEGVVHTESFFPEYLKKINAAKYMRKKKNEK